MGLGTRIKNAVASASCWWLRGAWNPYNHPLPAPRTVDVRLLVVKKADGLAFATLSASHPTKTHVTRMPGGRYKLSVSIEVQ